ICEILRDTCSWINISKTESTYSIFARYPHCLPPTIRTSTIFNIYLIGSAITSHLKMVTCCTKPCWLVNLPQTFCSHSNP
ncbi:hypothetical protein GIB67_028123, partial [Kingdonia uniflora]